MFQNIKWLRLTPDRPGRGGTKTGIHTFQQEPVNDVRSLTGGHIYQGAWTRDYDAINYPNPQSSDATSAFVTAVHGYVYPSLTDPAAQPGLTVLTHHLNMGVGTARVWDYNTGTVRSSRPTSGFNIGTGIFQNISGRCFFGDGKAEGLIMDDRTPAIHAQKNQLLGIGTPHQPMSNTGGNLSPAGTGYVCGFPTGATLSPYINHPNPDNMIGTILATDTVRPRIIDPNWTAIYSGTIAPMVDASPAVDAVTSNTTPFTATGTISITNGTSLVTLAGATWPANFKYVGLAINFNGYSFVILMHGAIGATNGLDLQGNAIALSNVQLLVLGVYDGPTVTAIPYTITGCQVTMTNYNGLSTVNTNIAATPPGVAQGYGQMTASNLVQIKLTADRVGGYSRNLGNISMGPPAADSASGGSIQTITDATMADGKKLLTSASNPFASTDEGVPIAVDGAGAGGITLITTIATYVTSGSVRLATNNISGGPIAAANAWWGGGPTISDGAMTIGSTTLTSASNPFVTGDVGQVIVVDGAAFGATALITTISAYVGPGNVTLAAPSVIGVSGKNVWWRGISVEVHEGPTYAYAWYDPETGHMSNVSPLYQIPRPTDIGSFTDFSNVTPVFQIDSGSISYPSGTDALRFSHIMFFRTLSTVGSSTLYPIGSLQPFVGKVHPGAASTRGSWNPSTFSGWMGLPSNYTAAPPLVAAPNYWYDWSSDSDLLLSGGFRAPQFTNEKPMALLRGGITQPGYPYAMSYWDRRLWIVDTQEPDKIAFSCDDAQCPLGIPTESFPPTNFLRLPSVDGRVIGMRTVGDMLLITTERWAYIIAGNNESNYRLMKASSSMPGVGTYQMDEFPTYTGAEGEPTTLFYLGRDRIVYQWTVGGPVTPISRQIQDQLDVSLAGVPFSGPPLQPLAEYLGTRLHCVSAYGRRLVIVAPYVMQYSAGGIPSFIYDIDNQAWSSSLYGDGNPNNTNNIFPMTTVYGLDPPVNELYAVWSGAAGLVVVRSWIRDDVTTATGPMVFSTFPMNFDGKKTRKQIVALNLHATAGTWAASVYVNEATVPVTATFGTYPDPLDSIYAPVAAPVDPGAQDITVQAAQFSNPAPVVGYRFGFVVQKNADSNPAKVYALDIGYVEYEEAGEGAA